MQRRSVSDKIFTVVSRPGPAELRILSRLSPFARPERRVAAGVTLRTIESRGEIERSALVFLHGRGHAATVWEPFVRAFGEERRVVAVDVPGFGHSGISDEDIGSAESALDKFVAPVEALLAAEGPVVLAGHSLGGLVALELALRGRTEVRALVLIGSMGLGPYVVPSARAYLRFGPERLARLSRVFGGGANGLSGTPAGDVGELRSELYLTRGGRRSAKRAFDRLVPLVGPAFHRRDRLADVNVPTLLVWGTRDEAFPLPVAMDAKTRIRDATLEVLDTGHSPHIEAPDATLACVRRFLEARVDSPSTSRR